MQAGSTEEPIFLYESSFQSVLPCTDGGSVTSRSTADNDDVKNSFRQSDGPQ